MNEIVRAPKTTLHLKSWRRIAHFFAVGVGGRQGAESSLDRLYFVEM